MEIKRKFQTLFNGKGRSSLSDESVEEIRKGILDLPELPRRSEFLPEVANGYPTDPVEDDEILSQIHEEYLDENFNSSLYQLQNLPEVLDQSSIHKSRQKLLRQLTVVTKKVFAQILAQSLRCEEEMERVRELREKLEDSKKICSRGRAGLSKAKKDFTVSSLGILSAFRRRQQTLRLLHDLNIIKTLQRTDVRLQEMLDENDYPGAIQLIIECQKVASAYQHFVSISQLSSKLQDTLAMTEEALDISLSKLCVDFNESIYSRLYEAYNILGKSQTSMDQLHMHLTSAIHNTSWNVVFGHSALVSESNPSPEATLSKKPFADICAILPSESVLPCLTDLCSSLWRIMSSYRKIVNWHMKNSEDEYMKKKLENGLPRVWQDVQTKVRVFVSANDLSVLTIESFLKFMDVIHRLIDVGHRFCGSASDTLQESLKQQCWNYFQFYHAARLNEIKMHLDNESWRIVSVKATFKATQLSEFRHLKDIGIGSPLKRKASAIASSNFIEECPFKHVLEPIQDADSSLLNEFSCIGDEEKKNFYFDDEDSDSDIPEELTRETLEEDANEKSVKSKKPSVIQKEAPIITSTSLVIFRLCGNYLEMMKLLDRIALDIFASFCQLVEFYTYTIHTFFTQSLDDRSRELISSFELKNHLSRIQDRLFRGVESVEHCTLNPQVLETIQFPETLHGLSEKVVAVESAVYLASQMKELQPAIESLVTTGESVDSVRECFYQSINFVPEIRKPIYMTVASNVSNYENILQMMSKVAWDIKEVKSQHSNYVDFLLRGLQTFSMRLEDIRQDMDFEIRENVRSEIWNLCILAASRTFVDGFANVKKCSNEGRALMQLDYRQFIVKLEKVAEIKPIPYQDYVSSYIKAYYISEVELEDWVQQHTEYTSKHLESLVNCVVYNNNRTKQKLNNLISDISGRLRK